MKKTILGLAVLIASTGMVQVSAQDEHRQHTVVSHASTFADRFEQFVNAADGMDSTSDSLKARNDSIYREYLAEYRIVSDSLSDGDVRRVSKAKLQYQKGKVRNFADKASEQVVDATENVGSKISKVFKRTKKKVQGAIDALKN